MIQLSPSLMLDSTTMWIVAIAVILVFSLHFYLQRLMVKGSPAESVTASRSSAARNAPPFADKQSPNLKR